MFSFFSKLLWDESFEIAHRILNAVLFSFAIFTIIAIISNFITNEPLVVQIAVIFFFLYFVIAFYYSRVKKKWKFIGHLSVWLSFIGFVVFYIFDGGLFCGNGYFLLIDIAIIISIFKERTRIFYLFIMIILLISLLGLESYYPKIFFHLSKEQCAINIFLSFVIATFFLIFLLVLFVSQLEKQKLEKEVLSKEDYLTGLLNRRGIFEKLDLLLKSLNRRDFIFSIIIADIDDFKKINDTYGHITGDWVLKEVAKRISESLRAGDILGRWGGEEFIIILPYADLENAMEVGERIRQHLSKTPIEYKDNVIHITITLGVGEYNGELSLNKNLTLIDDALYRGKAKGKNCVIPVNAD